MSAVTMRNLSVKKVSILLADIYSLTVAKAGEAKRVVIVSVMRVFIGFMAGSY